MHGDHERERDSTSLVILASVGAVLVVVAAGVGAVLMLRQQAMTAAMDQRAAQLERAEAENKRLRDEAILKAHNGDAAMRKEERKLQFSLMPKEDQDQVRKLEELLRTREPLVLTDDETELYYKWSQYLDAVGDDKALYAKLGTAADELGFVEFAACVGLSKETAEGQRVGFALEHKADRQRMLDVARKIKKLGMANIPDEDKEFVNEHKASFGLE